jgi:Uma2 family endonuclease
MATGKTRFRLKNVEQLLKRLGGVAPRRVRLQPPPGTATEDDLIRLNDRNERLYELVDGTLVEKNVGFPESLLAHHLSAFLKEFLRTHDLGLVAGGDGGMRLLEGLVRLPDLAFVSWDQLPVRGVWPMEPISSLYPDLAVEVLSPSNSKGEIKRKLREYFLSGTRLVWLVDLRKRTVTVHTAPDRSSTLGEEATLDGGDVLPGLALPLLDVFAQVPRDPQPTEAPKRTRRKRGS